MWKTRNEIKYDKRAPNFWTTKDIKRVITEYEKHTGRNERYGIQEIGAWRKKKIDRWASQRKQATKDAIKRHEQSKTALQKFNDTWKIFRVLPFADAPTTTTEGEQDTPNHSTTRTEHADTEQDSEIRGTRLRKQRNREHEGAETQDSERTEQPSKEPEKEEDEEHEHRRRKRAAQQERKTAAHWDKITKQWQRARTKRQKTSKDAKEKQGRKRDNTEQTSITRFMTKRQKRDGSKEKSKKRKGEAGCACSAPRHTTEQHRKDSDDTEDAAGGGKTAATEGKRQKQKREGIG